MQTVLRAQPIHRAVATRSQHNAYGLVPLRLRHIERSRSTVRLELRYGQAHTLVLAPYKVTVSDMLVPW